MKTLLHICCAPCAVQCVKSLRNEGIEPVGFFYNPNIHPYTEYENRKNTLIDYADRISLALAVEGGYGLRPFVQAVRDDIENRCGVCYAMRMEAAAKYARENGFDAFTTTLLISPYQKHDQLIKSGEAAAAANGVEFLYRDFRPLFYAGRQEAKELGLYMQKYCGCIFSEEERYLEKEQKRTARAGQSKS
ncbi:MAG: epoxyqueuosine reductase QueH [Christensenellales bacterium]